MKLAFFLINCSCL